MVIMENKRLCLPLVLLCLYFVFNCFQAASSLSSHKSDIFQISEDYLNTNYQRSKRSEDVTDIEGDDESVCKIQMLEFKEAREKLKNGTRLEETHVFANESKYNLMLAWASNDDSGVLIVLTTHETFGFASSTLWRSPDHGRSWKNITDRVNNQVFRKNDGLQRNPHDPAKLYLISYSHYLHVTEDGGKTWRKTSVAETEEDKANVAVQETLEFHPEKDYDDYVAIISNKRELHVTYDNFMTPPKVMMKKVHAVKWGTFESKSQECLYATVGEFNNPFFSMGPELVDLQRYNRKTDNWDTILKRITKFDIQGQFMYASIFKSEHPASMEDDKLMMISSDGGTTWNEAQLPTVTGDRFFSVLDMSEGFIFMHVDNPGDTGHGTLYTSSSNGLIYSESLQRHLYPNGNTIHDFYKVESIRGVYLASQMGSDKSIHTVITYNRGGEWKNITRPVGSECKNSEEEGCFLQIHNAYSIHRRIKARLPHSTKEAVGIVLAHGHVASNLQTTDPDVYLSTDGGYNFRKVLTGPHAYEIADSGGLLVAVPMEDYPNTIKFSTDEGHCWHTYKFTSDPLKFTGLITEPGGKSMTVSIWGYHKDTKKWTVNVIDFVKVIPHPCKAADDYETWQPHTSLSKIPGHEGCLLGKREKFKRIKAGQWCHNGYTRLLEKSEEICICSEEDYECDFGFYRPDGSIDCVRQPQIQVKEIEICKKGHVEELESIGYRLIPGDVCNPTNGFKPARRVIDLKILCEPGDKKAIMHDESPPKTNSGSRGLVIFALVTIVLVIVAVIGAFFTYKIVLLRRHKVVYRYSMLNQAEGEAPDDNEFDHALGIHDTLYRDSSDEEVEQENKSPQHWAAKTRKVPQVKGYHDDSDDDMLG
ncbi:sortilin-like [Plakobranchus ocellatus]|uniref:Sortilin-like n=1 Tax=Plakobranchus ocellatus TaxID=259542 RepID=A0AAV3YP61_9GAST|nr:sortilin-like [Plakobranchus ocellatus]